MRPVPEAAPSVAVVAAGSAPRPVPGGRQRSAALGTRSASSLRSVISRTVAVMPGIRRWSRFSALMTTT
jgi:hypothetical protein